ncbi:sugar phosphate isomerase/epimerase family protein [Frondihabitans cladoniiphilus]|uniref:Sugar phosphate isomerase/epimerase n=1 Tax=Frondihabitans cladoniiphilus TaxID=715785 RepID=A0ABP8VK06_9MICO
MDETTARGTEPQRYAVDLFAFWHPSVWGLETVADIKELGARDPRRLWDRLLTLVTDSGVQAIEVTFAPFDWRTAVAAYGSLSGLLAELDARGLAIVSGYLPSLEDPVALLPENRASLLEAVGGYVDFLAAVGATALVGSAPLRGTRGAITASFVDLATASRLAVPFHEIGAICQRAGIRFALHTESHSQMWTARDIDLFMLATDPFYVGLCPDAAHIVLGGGDPVAIAAKHSDRLVTAHWKDATGPMSWDLPIDKSIHVAHREFCRVPGEGIVDWAAWAAVMKSAGLLDPVLLEIDAIDTPVESIRRAIRHLDGVLATV